jgi:hypothetical protein
MRSAVGMRLHGNCRAEDLMTASNEELAAINPLELNLLVARGILSQRNIDIPRYQAMAVPICSGAGFTATRPGGNECYVDYPSWLV